MDRVVHLSAAWATTSKTHEYYRSGTGLRTSTRGRTSGEDVADEIWRNRHNLTGIYLKWNSDTSVLLVCTFPYLSRGAQQIACEGSRQSKVGVGIMITHNPLHGSGQAALPHPALALGDDAQATQGIGMTDSRQWQPTVDEAPHAVPKDASVLAASRQRAMPEPSHLEPKDPQRVLVQGHSVVPDVSTHHRLQPFALVGDGFVHASLKFGFHLVQLRLQSLAYRLPQHRKPPIAPLLHADVRKAQEVERFRFPFPTPLPLVDRIRTELQKSRFLGMQFQVELPHSFCKFHPKLIGIRFAVKSNHDVIGKSHHDDISVCALLTPCLDPQIEYVMKIEVRQKRRGTTALGRPFLRPYPLPILQHAGPQPSLDEPHDAPVRNPVLDELHQPFVGNPIEKAFDVQIKHPVHFSRQQSGVQRIQRLMLAAPWSEPVREAEKIRFV